MEWGGLVLLVLLYLWMKATGDLARRLFFAVMVYGGFLGADGHPMLALLVSAAIVVWAYSTGVNDPDSPVRPLVRTSSFQSPTTEVSAQTPPAEQIPSGRITRPVARDTSGRGDIRLAERFGLPSDPGGVEPESLRYESGESILDDGGWIPYNSGSVAARCLERHGIRTLRGTLKYSQNELHEFEASADCEFVADLVDSVRRLAGKFDESEQSASPVIASENSAPASPTPNPIADWREGLIRELVRSGCRFEGVYVVLPNGVRKVAASTFDLQDIHDELKENGRGQ